MSKKFNMSRRGFITGGILTGAALGAGTLAGCAPAADQTEAAANATMAQTGDTVDWLGNAPEISDDEISENVTADVVVVGGGFSGQIAANSALDHGASSVIVLEKGETYRVGGAIMGTLNSRLHKALGNEYDPLLMYNEYMKCYAMLPDARMVMMWAYKSGEATDWLLDKCDAAGVDYTIYTSYPENFEFEKEIAATYKTGIAIDTTKHDNMETALRVLNDSLLSQGVDFRYTTTGEKLVQDDSGRVTGVIAKKADGTYVQCNANKGVILCTGDYSGDPNMCDAFLEVEVAELAKTNSFYSAGSSDVRNTGDGQKMACWAGAQMEAGHHASMAWARSGAFSNMPFLQVNNRGERFMNEALTIMFWPRNIYRQPDHASYQIVDANFEAHAAKMSPATPDGLMTTLPEAKVESCKKDEDWVSAGSIEELAEKLSMDPEILSATVERYNSMADGFDEDFGKLGKYIVPLDTPPFKAVEVGCGFAVALGGVYVNERLQIEDETGRGIPGLYAAGNMVGRRYGTYYEDVITGTSNAHALTHGYFAGKFINEDNR